MVRRTVADLSFPLFESHYSKSRIFEKMELFWKDWHFQNDCWHPWTTNLFKNSILRIVSAAVAVLRWEFCRFISWIVKRWNRESKKEKKILSLEVRKQSTYKQQSDPKLISFTFMSPTHWIPVLTLSHLPRAVLYQSSLYNNITVKCFSSRK